MEQLSVSQSWAADPAREDSGQGPEAAETSNELRFQPSGAWDFPLSRSEKVRQLFLVFDAEVSSGHGELQEMRRENEALRQRAAAAEAKAAETLRLLEESKQMASRSVQSPELEEQEREKDLQFFQCEMEAKAVAAEAAAANLDSEAEDYLDYQSVASSSDRVDMEPHSVVVCRPPPNTPLRRSVAEPSSSSRIGIGRGGEGCTGGSPSLEAPPPSPAQKQGFPQRRLSPARGRASPRDSSRSTQSRWSGLLLPGIKERDISQERMPLTPVLLSARGQHPATGPRGMRAPRAGSPRLRW
mmetsp:Transcript_73985/g.130695  ORF Transcript_73985/g.130695 Transcript_73985/m.130695 type:complete len:299 (-) Transcript_73985:87-983(-)